MRPWTPRDYLVALLLTAALSLPTLWPLLEVMTLGPVGIETTERGR